MKKVFSITALMIISICAFAQSPSNPATTVDSIKTEIIETDSAVIIKSVQVTSVQVSSSRIAQEIERYKYEKTQLEAKLKGIDNQIKEFERLLGGVIVTEKNIETKKETARKAKEKEEADKKAKDVESSDDKDKDKPKTPKN